MSLIMEAWRERGYAPPGSERMLQDYEDKLEMERNKQDLIFALKYPPAPPSPSLEDTRYLPGVAKALTPAPFDDGYSPQAKASIRRELAQGAGGESVNVALREPKAKSAWGSREVLGFATHYAALADEINAIGAQVRDGYMTPEQAQQAIMASPRAQMTLRRDFETAPASATGGSYLSATEGDGRLPIQRYLESSAPLYTSSLGAANYGLGKVLGLSEEKARLAGALGSVTEGVVSMVPGAGLSQNKTVAPFGQKKFNPNVHSFIHPQNQQRHLFGTVENIEKGGGYLKHIDDAQAILDAYQRGEAKLLGRGNNGEQIIRFDGVTGYNNNKGSQYFDQPTNVFGIKGSTFVSIVPKNPSWSPMR